MARFRPVALACAVLCVVSTARAQTPLDRALVVQRTIADANELLVASKSAAAVAVLEKHLTEADGSRAYLDLLRKAYGLELTRLQLANDDPKRVADVRTKLALLGATPDSPNTAVPAPAEPVAPPPFPGQQPVVGEPVNPLPTPPLAPLTPAVPPPGGVPVVTGEPTPAAAPSDVLCKAAALFKEASAELLGQPKDEPRKFGLAAALFQTAFMSKVEMSPDQLAAWAYCRVRLANDRLKREGSDPVVAAEVVNEVEDALKLVPGNAALQKVGGNIVAVARLRAAAGPAPAKGDRPTAGGSDGWELVETANFRVKHKGQRDSAEALGRAAEAQREQIFGRWSGPPGSAWGPKCEIVLHPTAAGFATATKQPAEATGRAVVHLAESRVTERRIDLRADDPAAADDALPRELTHVILADLFPHAAPPVWAETGMAVLASSPAELERYRRTFARYGQSGKLMPVETLFGLKGPPAERVTEFYVESVSLVEFLVKWKGEKAFKTFLGDSQRYGLVSALTRQYGLAGAAQLQDAWLRGERTSARGQTP
ncbi:hypothetical protein [Fimbriiglobus ruber]|uniref:Uncharacterized protein n=1 Tax=Fimbriiglobus ruber TaxID=1908690 RepID=A0A225D4H8_9BACT|nr:hypothetical protein [Fimbriiglobus ruber]OWK35843.1 hypothetical protein FRUB_08406 [Fimbriiglobus ruber]